MKLDEKRREIQLAASEAWRNSNCKGTVEIATSIGKTWISLDAIMTLPKGSKVVFLNGSILNLHVINLLIIGKVDHLILPYAMRYTILYHQSILNSIITIRLREY